MTMHPNEVGGYQDIEQTGSPFCLRDILYVLFRRKWQIFLCFVAVLAFGIYASTLPPVRYESTATLLLKPSRELKTLDPANPEDSRAGIRSNELMRAEMAMLKTRELAEIVVDEVGAEQILAPYQKPSSTPSLLVKGFILLNQIGREPVSATEMLLSATGHVRWTSQHSNRRESTMQERVPFAWSKEDCNLRPVKRFINLSLFRVRPPNTAVKCWKHL